jgi:hypothetical protein
VINERSSRAILRPASSMDPLVLAIADDLPLDSWLRRISAASHVGIARRWLALSEVLMYGCPPPVLKSMDMSESEGTRGKFRGLGFVRLTSQRRWKRQKRRWMASGWCSNRVGRSGGNAATSLGDRITTPPVSSVTFTLYRLVEVNGMISPLNEPKELSVVLLTNSITAVRHSTQGSVTGHH